MINTRIRYAKVNEEGLYKSVRFFSNGITTLYVELDKKMMQFFIKDARSHETVASGGSTKNFAVLKVQAKNALVAMKIIFQNERRK